jgi:hypothetical protein
MSDYPPGYKGSEMAPPGFYPELFDPPDNSDWVEEHQINNMDLGRDGLWEFLERIEKMENEKLLYILKNAARIATPKYRNKRTWVFVMEICSVGSTSSYEICERLKIDPEAKAKEI